MTTRSAPPGWTVFLYPDRALEAKRRSRQLAAGRTSAGETASRSGTQLENRKVDANANCTTDRTDADVDGFRVTHDCDDGNAGARATGAAKINDGLGHQCPGSEGYGRIDELDTGCGFHNPADKDELSRTAQSGATSYEVARSADSQFTSGR